MGLRDLSLYLASHLAQIDDLIRSGQVTRSDDPAFESWSTSAATAQDSLSLFLSIHNAHYGDKLNNCIEIPAVPQDLSALETVAAYQARENAILGYIRDAGDCHLLGCPTAALDIVRRLAAAIYATGGHRAAS